MELGKLGVWYFLDGLASPVAAQAAQRIESLGYSALWIPEAVGKHPFVQASWLLANTERLNVATGIASIYHREPGATLAGQNSLAEQSGDRFLLGLGVSHKPMVEGVRGLTYGPPVASMRSYLEGMDASPYFWRGSGHETQTGDRRTRTEDAGTCPRFLRRGAPVLHLARTYGHGTRNSGSRALAVC